MDASALLTRHFRSSFTPLLVMLLVIQGAFPLVSNSPVASLVLNSLMLAASIPAVRPSLRLRITAVVGFLVVLAVRVALVRFDPDDPSFAVAAFLGTAAYVAFIAVNVLSAVIRRNSVSANAVVGAICVYLLMAHVFALVYAALETSAPGSITGVVSSTAATAAGGHHDSHLHEFLYFSVITLTTLGYGDMLAITPAARALVMLEAMSGQFFVAVFVARLVGSWSSGAPPQDQDRAG
jgi:hypothetical protein